jgi:hypothetical protein
MIETCCGRNSGEFEGKAIVGKWMLILIQKLNGFRNPFYPDADDFPKW